MRRFGVLMAALSLAAPASWITAAPEEFPGCAPPPAAPGPIDAVVGEVACQQVDASETLGGITAFSYYVPPNCVGRTCPVLTLLHGFGGTYQSEAGTASRPSAKIVSLSRRPARDPYAVSDPWNDADTSAWVPADPLDFIVVAPHGRTIEGGFGPIPGLDSFWTNWNPRYANADTGNPDGSYDGPTPRFGDFVSRDLIAFVEERFASAGRGREWRALSGTSLGGYGAYLLGLQHPDVWASIGSVSGAHNFLFAPWLDPPPGAGDPLVETAPPVPLPYVRGPAISPAALVPFLPEQVRGFGAAFAVFGDPATDQVYFRGNMPRDLAMNARAYAAGVQSLHLRAFVNDAIPRRLEDLANPAGYIGSQAFEAIVLPMNLDQEIAFTVEQVERTFEIHPGLHSGAYWNAFQRAQMEAHYAKVRHWDGTGAPPAAPTTFDYRTIAGAFDIWGWRFAVDREPIEFLTIRAASCEALTLQGTGAVTVTVPSACGTGFDPDGPAGPSATSATFEVFLGNAHPIDEPLGLGALPIYGATRTIALVPLA